MDTTSSSTHTANQTLLSTARNTEDIKSSTERNACKEDQELVKGEVKNVTESGDGNDSHVCEETEKQVNDEDSCKQPVESGETADVDKCIDAKNSTKESNTHSEPAAMTKSDERLSRDNTDGGFKDSSVTVDIVEGSTATPIVMATTKASQEECTTSADVSKQENVSNSADDADNSVTTHNEIARCATAENDGKVATENEGTVTTESEGTISTESGGAVTTESDGTITIENDEKGATENDGTVATESEGTITVEKDGTVTAQNEATGLIRSEVDSTEMSGTVVSVTGSIDRDKPLVPECAANKMETESDTSSCKIDAASRNTDNVISKKVASEPLTKTAEASAPAEVLRQKCIDNRTFTCTYESQKKKVDSVTGITDKLVDDDDTLASENDVHTEMQTELSSEKEDEVSQCQSADDSTVCSERTTTVIRLTDKMDEQRTDLVKSDMVGTVVEDTAVRVEDDEQQSIKDSKAIEDDVMIVEDDDETMAELVEKGDGKITEDDTSVQNKEEVMKTKVCTEVAIEEEFAMDTSEGQADGTIINDITDSAEVDTASVIGDDIAVNTATASQAGDVEKCYVGDRDGAVEESKTETADSTGTEETGEPAKKKQRQGSKESVVDTDEPQDHSMPATHLFEYQWPAEKGGEWFMIQEQLSEFLGVVSFKRRYPDLQRRPLELKERIYLLENGIVTEMQSDLGLTALKMDQVHELMSRDYPDKFQEYAAVLHKREQQKIADHHKGYEMPQIETHKLNAFVKNAVKSAAEFNALFMKERREERKAYIDLQTNVIHYPQRPKKFGPHHPVGAYPVALIPGQFQDYYKSYTAQELKYLPLSTALYTAPRPLKTVFADPNQPSEEDTEEEKDDDGHRKAEEGKTGGERNSDGTSSGSSSTSGSTSGSENESEAEKSADSVVETPASKATNCQNNKRLRNSVRKSPWLSDSVPNLGVKKELKSCNICKNGCEKNRIGEPEDLVTCSECVRSAHPSCLELTTEMIPIIRTYPWQCMECKTCNKCMTPHDEDKMMFCDHCDRGYHSYCVGLRSIPTGRWDCSSCQSDTPRVKRTRRR